MTIYLDVCCLNRPFDDLSNERIRLEADAVELILQRCEQGKLDLVSSDIVLYEISRMPNPDKKEAVIKLQEIHKSFIAMDEDVIRRAKEFEKLRIKPFDALHLASAEKAKAGFFLTTDDLLVKQSSTIKLAVKILNPLQFIIGEILQ